MNGFITFVVSEIENNVEVVNFRIYVSDLLKVIAETRRVTVKKRYADLLSLNSKKKEKMRTAEEIIQSMLDKTEVKLSE